MLNFAPDLIIESRYRLIENLGEGCTGQVWKAEEFLLSRPVAIKFVHMNSTVSDWRSRLENEGRILSDLEDPNIVQFYRFSVWQEQPFIVLEYVPGPTLRAVLDSTPRLPYERALNIARQLLSAAMAAHSHGVVHRDFKPGNIIVCESDTIKIVDFGIAKTFDNETSPGNSSTNAAASSVRYMSPERCTKTHTDYRTDLYSIGCILYEMLVGHPPFSADNAFGLMQHHLHTPPPAVPSVLADTKTVSTPPALNKFIAKILAKDADARFQSAAEAKTTIEALLESAQEDLTAQRELHTDSIKRTVPRSVVIRTSAAVLLIISALTATWLTSIRNKPLKAAVPSSRANTLYVSSILRPRNSTFLNQYPVDTRIKYYEQWLKEFPQALPLQRAIAHSFLADDYRAVFQSSELVSKTRSEGAALYREAIDSGSLSPRDSSLANISLANIYKTTGQYDQLEKLLTNALKTDAFSEGPHAAEAYQTLSEVYIERKAFKLAKESIDREIEVQKRRNYPQLLVARATLRKARTLYGANAKEEAARCLNEAQHIAAGAKDAEAEGLGWIQWLRECGNAHRVMGNPREGLNFLYESRNLARKADAPSEAAIATATIAECHNLLGNRAQSQREFRELSRTPDAAMPALEDYIYSSVKESGSDNTVIEDIQECLLEIPQKAYRQNFVAVLNNKDLSKLSIPQQERFKHIAKRLREFIAQNPD